MKSKKRTLEEAVIDAARAVTLTMGYGYAHETYARLNKMRNAIQALDAHLAPITDEPGAFVPGSDTSENAARLSRLMVGSIRRRIVDEIRSIGLNSTHLHGLTDDELERRLHRPHTTVSSARNWLCQAGWLQDSHFTRTTSSGRDATVWELTPAAKAAVASPEWVERSKA
jgi:hypothetical protein